MSTVLVNGIKLYYEEHGTGAPILLIHGTSSSALVWGDAVKEVAKRGRCIVYDRRGCFRSERPVPYDTTDVTEHADDAAALLDSLDAAPAIVIGRSYGGETALDLAWRYPNKVRALALLEPAILTLDPEAMAWAEPLKTEVLATEETDVSSVGRVFIRGVLGEGAWESFPLELQEMFTHNSPAIVAEMRGRWLDLSPEDLAAIEQPTLVVLAADSPEAFRRVDELVADIIPNSEAVLVEGGQFINPAHPVVLEFLDRLLEPDADR
jgi:pimeloyl-ACP methyl ester carboxylesterase